MQFHYAVRRRRVCTTCRANPTAVAKKRRGDAEKKDKRWKGDNCRYWDTQVQRWQPVNCLRKSATAPETAPSARASHTSHASTRVHVFAPHARIAPIHLTSNGVQSNFRVDSSNVHIDVTRHLGIRYERACTLRRSVNLAETRSRPAAKHVLSNCSVFSGNLPGNLDGSESIPDRTRINQRTVENVLRRTRGNFDRN